MLPAARAAVPSAPAIRQARDANLTAFLVDVIDVLRCIQQGTGRNVAEFTAALAAIRLVFAGRCSAEVAVLY